MDLPKKVIKRENYLQDFKTEKIENAIKRALIASNKFDENLLKNLTNQALNKISQKFKDKYPHVEEIQDIIEQVLIENNLYETSKAFILYRKEREKIREEKKKILNKEFLDEIDKRFSVNALRVLSSRYLLRDEKGKIIESPKQLFERVAALVVISDILYDEKIFDKYGKQKIHEYEEFDAKNFEGKISLAKKVFWNKYHLERMKALYDELNSQQKMKVRWSEFLKMLENGEFDKYYENFLEYFNLMAYKKFFPNSPTLFNAATRLGMLSACFVLDVEDSIESIMDLSKNIGIIFKAGGGVGVNYSKIRPEGDIIRSTFGIASGPISFMRLIDNLTNIIKSGGKRRGANMGILEIWHPDIEKFISSKNNEGFLENFNISVLINERFIKAFENNEEFELINPRDGKVWKRINARDLFIEIAKNAWNSAEPGVLFLENINKYNVMKESYGLIKATNPCGEVPQYPYESCNLGSINLYAFIKRENDKTYFDWNEFIQTIKIATRFLDNVIDVNNLPLKEIGEKTKKLRRIGLGIMGLAETLFALKIRYNSEEGFEFMRKIGETLAYYATLTSIELAEKRGSYPEFEKSLHSKGFLGFRGVYELEKTYYDWNEIKEKVKNGIRNVALISIAPTGTISMIADTSAGIEPQFSLVFEKEVSIGKFYYVDYELEMQLKERGLYKEEIIKKISESGSIQSIEEIPNDMKEYFVIAYEIPWQDHLRAQYEFSFWVDNGISKTINMPFETSWKDVLNAFYSAYKLGLKGITIFREGSRIPVYKFMHSIKKIFYNEKTLEMLKSFSVEVKSLEEKDFSKKIEDKIFRCPNCGSNLIVFRENCLNCLECSWNTCLLG
ncbi:MAG: adenosylcobalamin-dependent ribonucleoside-diphosphate reductase [Candidatus Aenigmatarchaeota archaeon]